MAVSTTMEASPGLSLRSLVKGFVLTKHTEGKSQRTVEDYDENLRHFLWYADRQGWSDDIRFLTEWQIRQFLGYVGTETNRWGLEGNGSETSQCRASHTTLHHYWVTLSNFFNWVVKEGFAAESPLARIRVAKPKPKVVVPYSSDEIGRMLAVCDYDYEHNARFVGSRNRAMTLVLLDTGVRLSELVNMKVRDINTGTGYIRVLGKGSKERVVRIGKVAQKALWRYLMCRGHNDVEPLWLTEERRPLHNSGVQSLVKRLKERAGVTGEGSVHRFRHSFALSFLRTDRNVFNLQYLLGHSDLEMVRRYTSALGMEDALRAHETASPADLLHLA
ncbi:MAG: tyrosine-type recombinase/integrase [Dehalococcoidia bacterium]